MRDRLFTAHELEYVAGKVDPAPSLAARFSGSLRDRLSGAVVPVSSNALALTLPAHGAMVLAP